MKKLKKILLINWLYFSKQVIEVGDINFLTGNNGAGKSTVIDALQIVLLGELNARNFNKAANESSQRTLDGYLRADMDPGSGKSRRGKDFSSYIACEYYDDQKGVSFVTGIVFDCHNDGSRQNRFFIYDGKIPEHCFLVSHGSRKQAMTISELRTYFKAIPAARIEFFETGPQYRRVMLSRWNLHSDQVCRMMKKAVSFRPIVDIQQFITENICDIPNRPDIEAMQQNIRDYKRHEQLAQRQEEKLKALDEISRLYREMNAAIDRMQQQSFLILWAEKAQADSQILKLENEKKDCQAGIQKAKEDANLFGEEIQQKTKRKEALIADRTNSSVYQEKNRLEAEKTNLAQERSRLTSAIHATALEIKKEAQVLLGLCQTIEGWKKCGEIEGLMEAASDLEGKFAPLSQCSGDDFQNALSVFEDAQIAASRFGACLRDAAYRVGQALADKNTQKDSAENLLKNLRRNVKPYPKGLLDLKQRLESGLGQIHTKPIHVEILADVLEIADGQDNWRGAIEGYLNTQKFYLLVEPAYLGIYARPEIYELSGNISLSLKGGIVDCGPLFPEGIALRSTSVESIEHIDLSGIRQVIFIENKTNYDAYLTSEIRPADLIVYHGGFLSPQKRKLIRKICDALPAEIPVYFWADIDLGGFRMFAELQSLLPQLQPMRMDASHVTAYASQGLARSEKYLKRIKVALENGEYPLFSEAMQAIITLGVTIEQEVFLSNGAKNPAAV